MKKELAQAVSKPGQTKLGSFFFVCAPISPARDSACHDSTQIISLKEVEYFNNVSMEVLLTGKNISSEENSVSTIKRDNFWVKKGEGK